MEFQVTGVKLKSHKFGSKRHSVVTDSDSCSSSCQECDFLLWGGWRGVSHVTEDDQTTSFTHLSYCITHACEGVSNRPVGLRYPPASFKGRWGVYVGGRAVCDAYKNPRSCSHCSDGTLEYLNSKTNQKPTFKKKKKKI